MAFIVDARLFEVEDILNADRVALDTRQFSDAYNFSATAGEPCDMNQHIQRGSHLLSDDTHGKIQAGNADHVLDAA